MRLGPAFAASSNTSEPSTFSLRVASPALRIAEGQMHDHLGALDEVADALGVGHVALAVLGLLPAVPAGSNGLRAIPTMRLTARERCRALTTPMPRSPVGPVTATVRPLAGMGQVLPHWVSAGGAKGALGS